MLMLLIQLKKNYHKRENNIALIRPRCEATDVVMNQVVRVTP